MQTSNKILDDLAKLAGSAAGVMVEAKKDAENRMRAYLEQWLAKMDLVTREEFEVVKTMAAKAREENEALAKRIAELEVKPKGKKKTE